MTNTIHYELYRDDASVSTSSEVSQQLSIVDQDRQPVSSSLYSVIGKVINTFRFQRSGLHSKDTSNDEHGYESSEILSSASLPSSPRHEGHILETPNLMSFSLKELKKATKNFHSDTLLGEGGFGGVFKGWIDDKNLTATKPGRGLAVAVKILNKEGYQGHEEWLAEITYLGKLYHPNLVKLYGYCLIDDERLLVYEFMARGSLDNHLFRRGSSSFIPWSLRMRVALGAAKGLAFLHRADINIIHRGVQCSNILLDSDFNAKLCDFGLAKDGPTDGLTHVTTRIMGTYGYAAPEYVRTGHLTAKCDVYSFGVVLLEMLCGRKTLDVNRPRGEQNLVEWAKPYLRDKRKISRVLDNYVDGQCPQGSAQTAANLILKCLDNEAKLRPNMDEVVTTLIQLQ